MRCFPDVLRLLLVVGMSMLLAPPALGGRCVIRLDGVWQIAQGTMTAVPKTFPRRIRVPGLVDMATPPFRETGVKSPRRGAFWYRRTFQVPGTIPAIALLKIHKAKFGTQVILNGKLVGEHVACFTPGYFDVRPLLRGSGEANELIVRVGADRESMPRDVPSGWDFEKYRFYAGIYDSVELILTDPPFIRNVQIVPDLVHSTARVVAEVQAGPVPCQVTLHAEVFPNSGGPVVGTSQPAAVECDAGQIRSVDFTIPIADCHPWSPEDPFLYQVRLDTGSDQLRVRFGMRTFRFDPGTGHAVLNGKPYFLRGTNVCVFRFFEDAQRGELPWGTDWVRRLHQQFKTMHWNAIRYCIGFPPDFWYDIADEEGLLIQDEFPIWLGHKAPEDPKADRIAPQYVEWMRERWNHPCVAIWDAQNESWTQETGKALQRVRPLDLSDRPWENGYPAAERRTDCVESHAYLFNRMMQDRKSFYLRDLATQSGVPHLTDPQAALGAPILINEYGWLWLDRRGNPTCLTRKVYDRLLGPDATAEQRRMLYARHLAALTEFWRAHRRCAGVLHFCGLGYSRPGDKPRPEGGATSDAFIDIRKLTFEPHFLRYVGDAFSPVGVMLDFWDDHRPCGTKQAFPAVVLNDLPTPWQGTVELAITRKDQAPHWETRRCTVPAWGRKVVQFTAEIPLEPGVCTVIAKLTDVSGRAVESLRDFHAGDRR